MTRRSRSRKSHRRHRGGAETTMDIDVKPEAMMPLNPADFIPSTKEFGRTTTVGGRRKHKRSRRHSKRRGGSMLATAALPFGLFGLQKYFQKSRVNPLRRMGRSARRTVKRVF
jgi:hypothetical protein